MSNTQFQHPGGIQGSPETTPTSHPAEADLRTEGIASPEDRRAVIAKLSSVAVTNVVDFGQIGVKAIYDNPGSVRSHSSSVIPFVSATPALELSPVMGFVTLAALIPVMPKQQMESRCGSAVEVARLYRALQLLEASPSVSNTIIRDCMSAASIHNDPEALRARKALGVMIGDNRVDGIINGAVPNLLERAERLVDLGMLIEAVELSIECSRQNLELTPKLHTAVSHWAQHFLIAAPLAPEFDARHRRIKLDQEMCALGSSADPKVEWFVGQSSHVVKKLNAKIAGDLDGMGLKLYESGIDPEFVRAELQFARASMNNLNRLQRLSESTLASVSEDRGSILEVQFAQFVDFYYDLWRSLHECRIKLYDASRNVNLPASIVAKDPTIAEAYRKGFSNALKDNARSAEFALVTLNKAVMEFVPGAYLGTFESIPV